MIVIPTLEIRNGACAFALDDDSAGAHRDDPVSVVRAWASAGFSRLHLVDIDALNGIGSNASLVENTIRDADIEIQVNGGVQTSDGVQALFDAGATRVVLGTRAVAEPDWLASVVEVSPGAVVVEIALRDRRVMVRGWARSLPHDIFEVLDELNDAPLAAVLVAGHPANEGRDATQLGLLEDLVEACEVPVLVSGGVATMNDLRALEHRGLSGVVLGTSLLAGVLDPYAVAREFGA